MTPYLHWAILWSTHKPLVAGNLSTKLWVLGTVVLLLLIHILCSDDHYQIGVSDLCMLLTMDTVLLKALPWSKVDVPSDLADLYESPDVASLVDLLFKFVGPAFLHALLNGWWVIECPALDPVCLTNLLTCVAARVLNRLCTIAAEMNTVWINGTF